MGKKKIAVIGAGVGGLSTAARLGKKGHNVEVFEKLDRPGGRANIIYDHGFKFDTGPSFVMMPEFYKEAFDYCGVDMKDYLDLKVLPINYAIFYPDKSKFNVYQDLDKTKQAIEDIEPGASKAYEKFLADVSKIYSKVETLLYRCYTPGNLFNPKFWPLIFQMRPFSTYWQLACKYFKNPKLRFAFTFEAMFIGVSPFEAPAFYSIVTYVDHIQNIYHSMGGMYKIPLAFERLAKENGAKMRYSLPAKAINRNNGGFSIETERGNFNYDIVVANSDYVYTRKELLNKNIPDYDYSCSVILFYFGVNRKVSGLEHHNLFFARDLERNLSEVFKENTFSADPSFYVHVPTLTDPSLAPQGKDIVYVLVPAPNLKNLKEDVKEYEKRLREIVFKKFKEHLDIDLESIIEVEHAFYPEDFKTRYNIHNGATFGLGHTLRQSAFFRPANRDSKLKGIYYVGASTQPGGGLPPVIAGSRIVADLIGP